MLDMQGVAFITGAASGLGKEAGFIFAERGASVVVFTDVNEDGAKAAAEESQTYATASEYRALGIQIDVTDQLNVGEAVQSAVKECGRIDYGVHCAGIGSQDAKAGADSNVQNMNIARFDQVQAVNVRGTAFVTSELLKAMSDHDERFVEGRSGRRSVGRGAIVNVTSLSAALPTPANLDYSTSKAAANMITMTAALENARKGVRINALQPSWTNTPMMQQLFKRVPEHRGFVEKMSPAGRMAHVEEVAEVIWLCAVPARATCVGQR